MKTNLKRALIPFGVIVLGIVGAFANNAKQSEKANGVLMTGYRYDITKPIGSRCVALEVDCNTISGPICTDGNIINPLQVWGSSAEVNLQCSQLLFKNLD